MFRQFHEPLRSEFDCDADYFEALHAWDHEKHLREQYYDSKR